MTETFNDLLPLSADHNAKRFAALKLCTGAAADSDAASQ
jgi:hypothetical protein